MASGADVPLTGTITYNYREVACPKCHRKVWWKGHGRHPDCAECGGSGVLATLPKPNEVPPLRAVPALAPAPAADFAQAQIGDVLREALSLCTDLAQHATMPPPALHLATKASLAAAALADLVATLADDHEPVINWEVHAAP